MLNKLQKICEKLPKSPPETIIKRVRGIVGKSETELTDEDKTNENLGG